MKARMLRVVSMITNVARWLWDRWNDLSAATRNRILVVAGTWVVFKLIAWIWDIGTLLSWLIIGFAIALMVAESGMKKAQWVQEWFYVKFAEQIRGLVVFAMLPIAFEALITWVRMRDSGSLIALLIIVGLIIYMWVRISEAFGLTRGSKVDHPKRTGRRNEAQNRPR